MTKIDVHDRRSEIERWTSNARPSRLPASITVDISRDDGMGRIPHPLSVAWGISRKDPKRTVRLPPPSRRAAAARSPCGVRTPWTLIPLPRNALDHSHSGRYLGTHPAEFQDQVPIRRSLLDLANGDCVRHGCGEMASTPAEIVRHPRICPVGVSDEAIQLMPVFTHAASLNSALAVLRMPFQSPQVGEARLHPRMTTSAAPLQLYI